MTQKENGNLSKNISRVYEASRSNALFAYYVCNRDRVSPEHNSWDELLKYLRVLILMPRGSLKTTLFVESYITKCIIEKQDIRIGLICAKYHPHAKRRVKAVQKYLKSKNAEIYSQAICGRSLRKRLRNADTWDMTEINIPMIIDGELKERPIKEANLVAGGVDQPLTGEHYDILILDDVVNVNDRKSKAERDTKREWFPEIFDFAEDSTQIIIIGTRWHPLDLYGFILNEYGDEFHVHTQSIYNPDGSLWLPEFYEGRLNILKKNPIHFSHQYLNVAIAGEDTKFKREWFEFIDKPLPYNRVIMGVDPAYSERDIKNADSNAAVLVAQGAEPFILNSFIERKSLGQFKTEDILRLDGEYNITIAVVENNGVQKAAPELVKANVYQRDTEPDEYAAYERFAEKVIGTGAMGNADKATRAQPVADYAEFHGLKVVNTPGNRRLVEQLCYFPAVDEDDGVDALSNAWTRIVAADVGSGATTADYKREKPRIRF